MSGFLSEEEVQSLGLAAYGRDVLVSRKASLHGASRIRLGNHVRIDDFCVLSAGAGGITIGDRVHVAIYTSLIGREQIHIGDYANLSSRVSIYSSSDDFSGEWMTNPTVPPELTGVTHAKVSIGRHVIVGSGSIVLPGVTLGDGVAVGALTLVKHDCEAFGIYVGTPARLVGGRSRRLLELERQLHSGENC